MINFDLAAILSSPSFGSFWYWLLVAISWSQITHFSLGVGLHDVRDAVRNGGQDMKDVEDIVSINARRLTTTMQRYGTWLAAIGTFLIASMFTLGFWFDFELMQAMSLLVFGLVWASILAGRFAQRVIKQELRGEALCKGFTRLRTKKQFVGIFMIFIISFYAAYTIVITRGI